MKKNERTASLWVLCLLLFSGILSQSSFAQGRWMDEKFDYPEGNLLSQGGWTEIAAKTNTINVVSTPLSYTGYEQTPKSIRIPGILSSRLYKQFKTEDVSSGSIYYSFLLKVDTIKGNSCFIAIGQSATTTQYFGRIAVKEAADKTKFHIGVGRAGNPAANAWSTEVYDTSVAILVVLKYTFVEGDKNDKVVIFVNPTLSAEPETPTAENGTAGNADATALNSVFLYPTTSTFSLNAWVNISALRVASTWADIMGSGSVEPSNDPILTITDNDNPQMLYQYSAGSYKAVVKGEKLKADVTLALSGSNQVTIDKPILLKAKVESAGGDTITYTITAPTATPTPIVASINLSTDGLLQNKVIAISCGVIPAEKKENVAKLKEAATSESAKVYALENLVVSFVGKMGEVTTVYAQDATGGIFISDDNGVISTYGRAYKVGDKLGLIYGTTTPKTTMSVLKFLPEHTDPGAAIAENIVLTPAEVSLAELKSNPADYECELVKIKGDVSFYNREAEAVEGKFAAGAKNYKIRQTEDQTEFNARTLNGEFANIEIPENATIIGVSTTVKGNVVGMRIPTDIVASTPTPPEPPLPGNSLFSNGGFELWGGENPMLNPGGSPTDWTTNMGTSSKELTVKIEGNNSFKITKSTKNNKIEQEVGSTTKPVFIQGETYKIKINYYVVDGTSTGADLSMQSFWQGSGSIGEMENDKAILNNGTFFTSKGQWASKEFVTTVPQNAVSLYFKMYVDKSVTAYFDDFTMTKVESPEQKPILRVTPETLASFVAFVNQTDSAKTITVGGDHITQAVNLTIEGTNSSFFTVAKSSITATDFPATIKIYYKPTIAGTHRAELVIASQGAAEIRIPLNGVANEVGGKPTITVEYDNLTVFTAKPGERMEQTIYVSAQNMDDYVSIKRENDEDNNFMIGTSMLGKNLSNVAFKITYKPTAIGEDSAFVTFFGGTAAQVKVPVKGVCSATDTATWKETFENLPTDKAYGDYYATATKGSWHLVNTKAAQASDKDVFNGTRSIRMGAIGATLAMDFDLLTGAGEVSVMAAACKGTTVSAQWEMQQSSDFGLTWKKVGETKTVGVAGVSSEVKFVVNQVGPVRLRFVKLTGTEVNGEMNIDDIVIKPFSGAALTWDQLANLNTANPLSKLNESFDSTRHNKPVVLNGWRNFITKGERPWWTFTEKDNQTQAVINYTAKATAYNSLVEAAVDHEMWLVTPALNGKTTGSKLFTFRVMGDFMFEHHQTKVECFYIEKEGSVYHKEKVVLEMPSIADENGDWREFHIDLSKSNVADTFFMGFCFTGPGGKNNSVVYYIDDISYGRTDIPTITSSITELSMKATAYKVTESAPIVITGNNLSEDMIVTVGGANPSNFTASTKIIPSKGGVITVLFMGQQVGVHSAYLRFSSKGAADYLLPMSVLVTAAVPTIIVAVKDTLINLTVEKGSLSATSAPIIANPFVLTQAISMVLEGKDAAMFSLSRATIPVDGVNETFTVKFTPKDGAKLADCYVRLTSQGAADVLIHVKGSNPFPTYNDRNNSITEVIAWQEGDIVKVSAQDMKELIVYTMSGREVYRDNKLSNYKEFSLANEPSGLYLLKVTTVTGMKVIKIVK